MVASPEATSTRRATAGASRNTWAIALGVVALALAVALAYVWQQTRLPGESSVATTFTRDMTAHHTQAVDMALTIRDRTSDAALRQFTLDIILTQQAQIGQMQGWLAVWRLPLTGVNPPMNGHGDMMGMAAQDDLDKLRTLPVADAELLFLQLMTRHHQGGVSMAKDILGKTGCPEIERLAGAIVKTQDAEITYMAELLAERGAKPLDALPAMQMYN